MNKKTGFSLIALTMLALPAPVGYVNDFANILTSVPKLEQQIINFEKETSNEITIVTVNTLQGETSEEYAVRLFEQWQIGKANKDNGILILIAPNEREIRIEVGYGLEGALPDSLAYLIIQKEILPAFKKQDYQTGVENGLLAIMQAIKGEYESEQKTDWLAILIGVIFLSIFIIFFFTSGSHKKGLGWFLLGMFFGRGFGGSSFSGRNSFRGFSGGSSGGGGASSRW